jgi:hypothetical protein
MRLFPLEAVLPLRPLGSGVALKSRFLRYVASEPGRVDAARDAIVLAVRRSRTVLLDQMLYSAAGVVAASIVAVVAWRCSRSPGGFYDRDVYGMSATIHRRYALVSLAFALYFTIACMLRLDTAGIAGLALYALIAVFYAASFLQGAHDE